MNVLSLQKKINKLLLKDNFNNIPFIYQRSIIIEAYQKDTNIVWSYTEIVNWHNDIEIIQNLINDYILEYPDKSFAYGEVPLNLVIERVMCSSEFKIYNTFDEYYKWFGNHEKESEDIFPLVCDDKDESYIKDGWARLNNFYEDNYENIPIVKYV